MALLRRHDRGTRSNQVAFDTLHTVSSIAPALREGLTEAGAQRVVRPLRTLLGVTAVALAGEDGAIGVDGGPHRHRMAADDQVAAVLRTGRTDVQRSARLACGHPECDVRVAVAAPLVEGDSVVGVLVAHAPSASAALVRAVDEVSRWVSTQLELAAANRQHARAVEAELRALRAQISPHFIYNALTAIASLTRTDPDRARDLLLEFADFTRYALRGGQLATVADELRNTERYLELEQARFGDRLAVLLRVAPEVLAVAVPFLVIQPLVENAVRHGLEGAGGRVTVTITAADAGADAVLTVEDDGAGASPDAIRASLERAGRGGAGAHGVGLGNVDARLRAVYGDPYGLVVETAPGAGTTVRVRVPKSAPGVVAQPDTRM